jgi:hypothetical protein
MREGVVKRADGGLTIFTLSLNFIIPIADGAQRSIPPSAITAVRYARESDGGVQKPMAQTAFVKIFRTEEF